MPSPIFAQPTPDENLSPGWNVQGNGSGQSVSGAPGTGYAEAAVTGSVTNEGQAGAGYPNPPGALNRDPSENSASYSQSVLTNGSYSVSPTTSLTAAPATAPLPTTSGVQQPFGMSASVLLTGALITAIYAAPHQSAGIPSGTSAPWVEVWSGTAGDATSISFTVAPGGYIKTVGGAATAVTYTPTF